MTDRAIGEELHIVAARVNQLRHKVLRILRHPDFHKTLRFRETMRAFPRLYEDYWGERLIDDPGHD